MKYALSAGALLLGTASANAVYDRRMTLYREGTTPDTARIGGRDVATVAQPLPQGNTIDRSKWQTTCTSGVDGCNKVSDDSTDTVWLSAAGDAQSITIQLGGEHAVSGLTMVPRQDAEDFATAEEGNFIEEHQIFVSVDGNNWEEVAYGTWWPNKAQKLSAFQPRKANYVRLASNAPHAVAIADLEIYQTDYIPPNPDEGAWGMTIDLPLVPVSAAVDPITGEVVTWSSWGFDVFTGSPGGETQTATWHPKKQSVSKRDVTNTRHDMFCPGISIDGDGKFVVTGGTDQRRTSIYNASTDAWFRAAGMNIDRGYQASSTLSDGRIFVIGGSFSGGVGGDGDMAEKRDGQAARGKDGEIYDTLKNEWIQIPDAKAAPMLTNDIRTYRQDNHGWLFAWTNATVFQAGPSKAMNWYGTHDTGSVSPAGDRTGDADAMCGNAVMFDNGKILAMGGSYDYEAKPATDYASVISITEPGEAATVDLTETPMHYKRTFHSSVVLPDGSVFVNGGQDVALPFNESGSHYVSERFIPGGASGKWIKQHKNTVARVYHSLSLLLRDGTVFTAGGGLCGDCAANHFDGQIYTPPYLLNSDGSVKTDRPAIQSVSPASASAGQTITITTSAAVDETASLIRYGSATHTVNTDQRRVSVKLTKTGATKYTFKLPAEAGIAQPGYYMLFVLKNGVPSHSENVHVVPS